MVVLHLAVKLKTIHMKFIIFSVYFSLILVAGCTFSEKNPQARYELSSMSSGIMVEKFDSLNTDENKYNYNNEVFKIGTKFTYNFEHYTPQNELKFFKVNNDNKSWEFVDTNDPDASVVKNVIIGTLGGNPMAQFDPNYNQTAISYRFEEDAPFSISGVIENEANIWMHPPRDHYFKILELNPFPYIKAPYEVGTKWTWNLLIGSQWGDERWKTWEGNIENDYQYEITNKKMLATNFGNLECLVVASTAKSSLGETALTAYFHSKYGFVQLDYTNIDGSQTKLTLTKYSE
jgi:hypothetical protein